MKLPKFLYCIYLSYCRCGRLLKFWIEAENAGNTHCQILTCPDLKLVKERVHVIQNESDIVWWWCIANWGRASKQPQINRDSNLNKQKWSSIAPLQSTHEYRRHVHKHRVARFSCASRITVHCKCLRRLPLAWQRLSQASHVACTKCRTPRCEVTKSGDFTLTSSPPYLFWIDVGRTHGPRRSLLESKEWKRG